MRRPMVSLLLAVALIGLGAGLPARAPAESIARVGSPVGLASRASVPPAASVAVAVNPANGHQYVFWRSPRGVIDEAWFTTSWHGPVSRGWKASSAPSAAVNSAGQQYVAWAGPGGHIDETTYTGGWSRPEDLTAMNRWGRDGFTTATPAIAVTPAGDQPYLFWRGLDGRIEETVRDGDWQAPVSLGGSSPSAPTAGVTATGHQFVFWVTADGDIDEAWYYTSWSRPRDLTRGLHWAMSTKASSAPAVAINPQDGHQFVFWRGTGDHIYEAWNNGRWQAPANQGWRTASAPAAAVTTGGRQTVIWSWGARIYDAAPETAAVGRWRLNPGSGAYADVVESTASLSLRMTALSDVQFTGAATPHMPVIAVNDASRYQRIDGVGAAMTDTSAWLIGDQLSPQTQSSLMTHLFTPEGDNLDFTLIPIGGSDFTVNGRPYTFDDLPPGQVDPTLASFSIAHDEAYILPVLRQMLAIAPHTRTFAVPWSPPAWMKANDALDDVKHGGTLLPSAFAPLANYFVRFMQAYAAMGVPIDALAPENEPLAASTFPSMYFPEKSEDTWIVNDLVPALQAASLHPEIYGDGTSWRLEHYAEAVVDGPARQALTGLAWHCYNGIPTVMSDLHQRAPDLDQIVTECAPNLTPYAVPEILIGALRNWASMVTLWNVATDPAGGPVELPNAGCRGCRGLVTISEATHQVTYNLDYYQLGQVGSFLEDGATRIASPSFVSFRRSAHSYGVTAGLDDVALLNPDGSRVLVAYNNSSTTRSFAVRWRAGSFTYALPAGATVTFRWSG